MYVYMRAHVSKISFVYDVRWSENNTVNRTNKIYVDIQYSSR
jgi:hypothetical protein